jgi:hypothetical protein
MGAVATPVAKPSRRAPPAHPSPSPPRAGRLCALYLGTDPPSAAVAPSAGARPMDFGAMDLEHRELMARIKAAGGAGAALAVRPLAGHGGALGRMRERLLGSRHGGTTRGQNHHSSVVSCNLP